MPPAAARCRGFTAGGRPCRRNTRDRTGWCGRCAGVLPDLPAAADAPGPPVEDPLGAAVWTGDRALIANDPDTPPGTLAVLAADTAPFVRRSVARNPDANADTLDRLADDPHWEVRFRVAANPNTPPAALTRLAADANPGTRCRVAANPTSPPEAIRAAANFDDARWEAAANPASDAATLQWLATFEDHIVSRVVAHPNCSPGTLAGLASHPGLAVRSEVARSSVTLPATLAALAATGGFLADIALANPNCPTATLDQAADTHATAREAVARNPSTNPATLARLAADPDPDVRERALANPATPGHGRSAAGLLND